MLSLVEILLSIYLPQICIVKGKWTNLQKQQYLQTSDTIEIFILLGLQLIPHHCISVGLHTK